MRNKSFLYVSSVLFAIAIILSFSANAAEVSDISDLAQNETVSKIEMTENETLATQVPPVNQFVKKGSKIYFYNKNGELYKNKVFKYNSKYYVADKNGALYLGKAWRVVKTSDKKYHYVNELGEMYVPTKIRIRKWRAIDTKGNILVKSNGIYESGGKKYISDSKGTVYHGSKKVIALNGKKYICRENGSLYTGKNWRVVTASDGKHYYVDSNAKVYQPSKFVVKKWHPVTKSGRFKTIKSGPFMYKKHMYIANSKGVIYHSKKQLVTYKGHKYGVSPSGAIYRGSYFKINGKSYYAYKNGIAIEFKSSVKLKVPLISQHPELPTGCEITSVAQLIRYSGKKVDKEDLADEMPYHKSDPNKGYVGSPYKSSGWTIYPKALKTIVKKYTGSYKNMTGCSVTSIKWQIRRKKPVVVWLGDFDGWNLHCVIVTGYDENKLYFNDCNTGTKRSIKIKQFKEHWEKCDYRALSY